MELNGNISLLLALMFLYETNCYTRVFDTIQIELKSNTFVDSRTFTGPFIPLKRTKREADSSESSENDGHEYGEKAEQEIVDAHNDYRRQEGATGMEYMVCFIILLWCLNFGKTNKV